MEPIKNGPISTSTELTMIVSEVLGDLAFMVGEDDQAVLIPGTSWMECRISYRGPVSGTLHCWCTNEFALQLSANLLGLDSDDSAATDNIMDALREFMNVVCGQYVTSCYGREPVFDLSIPEAFECEAPPFTGQCEEKTGLCELCVSGEPFYCKHEPYQA